MPLQFNFAYSVSKEHPYVTEGFTAEEAFNILRRTAAADPERIFHIKEEGAIVRCPKTGNTYWIKLQE